MDTKELSLLELAKLTIATQADTLVRARQAFEMQEEIIKLLQITNELLLTRLKKYEG